MLEDSTKPASVAPHVETSQNEESNVPMVPTTWIPQTESDHEAEDAQLAINEGGHAEADIEDESKYPHGVKLAMLSFGLCAATWVVALDNTIIATASRSIPVINIYAVISLNFVTVPKITTTFPNALEDVGWSIDTYASTRVSLTFHRFGSAYLMTTSALQPSAGKVFTYFDVKWTYLSALVIFESKQAWKDSSRDLLNSLQSAPSFVLRLRVRRCSLSVVQSLV